MGIFKRTSRTADNYNDPALDDRAWLHAGQGRYDSLVSRHYGSPDTIAAGGDQRARADDPATALFFYQKAIDTLHSIYVCGFNDTGPSSWRRQPSPRDESIVERYLMTLATVRTRRPSAPVAASVREVTHRLRTISTQFRRYGLDAAPYLAQLGELGKLAPDVDVSGVFWE
jgi:hypothetical protein